MTSHDIRMPLAIIEGMHLAGLIDEFTSLLTDADDARDPGIERLTPSAYPEDAAASAEFATATRDDLLDRRLADAAVVRGALAPFFEGEGEGEGAAEGSRTSDAATHREVVVHQNDLDAWLRTLTALRLVIAERLEITHEDDLDDADDPRFGVFHWLGFRLDLLISIADELDGIPTEAPSTEE
ncbi:DUF2017 family protein [Microbacterium sp.]|uniref:DUF2017 family protein n=1 Tax=Microbacterium sp. TaxID=51671 RepID=UPI003F943308